MSDRQKVGYKNPPLHSRFQKGRSGNPRGRPKGARNLKTDLKEVLDESIRVREGDKQRSVSKRRAMILAQANKAMQGDTRAATLLATLMLRLLDGDTEIMATDRLELEDQDILKAYARRFADEPPTNCNTFTEAPSSVAATLTAPAGVDDGAAVETGASPSKARHDGQ